METRLPQEQVDRLFSEMLIHSSKEKKSSYDLRTNAPVTDLLHPKVLRALLEFQNNPQQDDEPLPFGTGFLTFLKNGAEAKQAFPHLVLISSYPAQFYVWNQKKPESILDFSEYGTIVYTHGKPSVPSDSLKKAMLSPWIDYATSPELWGPQGKWLRFDQRLRTLFSHFQLLRDPTSLGSYKLKAEAQILEKHHFFGTLEGDSYTLNLPWTFPLSALEALEKAVTLEFSHVHPKIR